MLLPAFAGRLLTLTLVAGALVAPVPAAAAETSEPVGTIAYDAPRSYDIETGEADPSRPSLLGSLIADVQLLATRSPTRGDAQIALVEEGGLRHDLRFQSSAGEGDGVVTLAELTAVQPERRDLVVMTLTGAQVRAALEEQFPAPGTTERFRALNVSEGLRYDLEQVGPPGARVQTVTLHGRPVVAAEDYRVTVNSFLASGGDGFTTFNGGTQRLTPGVDELAAAAQHFRLDSPVAASSETRRGFGGEAKLFMERLAGVDRYATAAETVLDGWAEADEVLLASGTVPVDALAGSYLAGVRDAPVLLTAPSALPQVTLEALRRLGAARVSVLGGPTAVGDDVLDTLRSQGFAVARIAGTDRYETAAAVARSGGSVGEVDGLATAVVAAGDSPVDALVAGSPAYAARLPVLLSTSARLSTAARDALQQLRVEQVLVIGGEAALSRQVVDDLEALGIQVRRLAGRDRQETAIAVAAFAEHNLGFLDTMVYLARGDDPVDALAGAPRAGRDAAPVVLTRSRTSIGAAYDWFSARCDTHLGGGMFGDFSTIDEFVESNAYAASECFGP